MQKNTQSELEAQASHLFQSNQLEDAVTICNSIIAQFPSSYETYNLLGIIAIMMEEYQGAISLLMKSLDIYPCQPITYCNLGEALAQLGLYEDAIFGGFNYQPELLIIKQPKLNPSSLWVF